MLSKTQVKYIRSLALQKFRDEHCVYIAEGVKIAHELLYTKSKIQQIIATDEWMQNNRASLTMHPEALLVTVTEPELSSVSLLSTPHQVMMLVGYPEKKELIFENEWYLALNDIQDPGNMGTMIRIADWFGIKSIICSKGCVNAYNPKVVQAAMGSHLRVEIYERELVDLLSGAPLPIYAATLDGDNIYDMKRQQCGILIIGNESKGIGPALLEMATHKISIPRKGGAESLNAAVSAGILCALLLPC